jgi:hypothetical protein
MYKLNNNFLVPKRNQPGCNLAYKYNMIYKTPIFNINWVTKKAGLNQCGNETTWGLSGYGKPHSSGLVSHIMGKPGNTKGGEMILISVVNCLCPRANIHHHKNHDKPRGWTKQGPFEVKCILEDVQNMVHHVDGDGDDDDTDDHQIFLWDELPHFTWDNYFSGDQIFDYMGDKGFGHIDDVSKRLFAKWHPR